MARGLKLLVAALLACIVGLAPASSRVAAHASDGNVQSHFDALTADPFDARALAARIGPHEASAAQHSPERQTYPVRATTRNATNIAPLSDEMAATFRGSQYTGRVLGEDTVLYRAGTANEPLGQFFSAEKPVGVMQTRIDKAIPPVWPGGQPAPLDTGFAVRIPAGTTVYDGVVANQGGWYMGGTGQIVVQKPWTIPGVKVLESWPLK